MVRKIVALVSIAALSVGFAACGGGAPEAEAPEGAEAPEAPEAEAPEAPEAEAPEAPEAEAPEAEAPTE